MRVTSHKMVKSLSRSILNKRVLVVKFNCSIPRGYSLFFFFFFSTAACITSLKFLCLECVRQSSISVSHGNNNIIISYLSLSLSALPVYSSLLQVGLVITVFAVFPNQLVWVRLVWSVFRHQGDPDSQGAAVVVHL